MPLYKSSRKILVLGSSLGLTLPALFVEANGIGKGEEVKVTYGINGVLIVSSIDDPEKIKESLMAIMEKLAEKAGKDGLRNEKVIPTRAVKLREKNLLSNKRRIKSV